MLAYASAMTDDTVVPNPEPIADAVVPKPARLRLLMPTVVLWCVLTMISSVVLYGERPFVRKALIDANANAKTPRTDYVGSVLDKDVSSVLKYGLIQAVLVSFILILVTVAVLRGRGWARWLLIGLATVLPILFGRLGVGIVFQLILGVISSAPLLYKVPLVLAGLAALAVVILLFLPDVRGYFSAVRSAEGTLRGRAFPPIAGARSGASMRAGGLFGARRGGKATSTAAATSDSAAGDVPGPGKPGATAMTAESDIARSQRTEVDSPVTVRAPGKRSGAAPKSRQQ